jgi:hypothetical protein
MPAEPRPFPMFTIIDPSIKRVSVTLSTSEVIEFNLDQILYPTDLVNIDHPDFETFYAVLRWLRSRNTNLENGFNDPQVMQAYFSAYFIPMEISP